MMESCVSAEAKLLSACIYWKDVSTVSLFCWENFLTFPWLVCLKNAGGWGKKLFKEETSRGWNESNLRSDVRGLKAYSDIAVPVCQIRHWSYMEAKENGTAVTLSSLNVDLSSVARLCDITVFKPAGVVSRLAEGAWQGPVSCRTDLLWAVSLVELAVGKWWLKIIPVQSTVLSKKMRVMIQLCSAAVQEDSWVQALSQRCSPLIAV